MNRVSKDGDVSSAFIGSESVTTTNLVEVATTVEVAVALVHLQCGNVGAAPTFSVILGTAEDRSLLSTSSNTLAVRARSVTVQLVCELAAGVVLLVAADVAVLALAIAEQGRRLFGNSSALESEEMLFKVGIVGIHSPRRRAAVGVGVPLSLGNSAHQGGSGALARSQNSSLSKINKVGGLDDAGNAKRRLGNGERQLDATLSSSVGDTELQRPGRVLSDVAESEVLGRVILYPSSAIGRLELDESYRSRACRAGNGKRLGSAIGNNLKIRAEGAADRRVESDANGNSSVGRNCGRNVGESELSDGKGSSGSVPAGEGTLCAAGGELDVSDGKGRVTLVGQDDALVRSTRLAGDNTLESDGRGSNGQQRTRALASSSESDMGTLAVTLGRIGCVDDDVGRHQTNGSRLEGRADCECLTGS